MNQSLMYAGVVLVLWGLLGSRLKFKWSGLSNRKLVRFANGKWGVRYGWVWHTWRDFQCPQYTWSTGSEFFRDCQTGNEALARNYMTGGRYEEVQ